MSAISDASPRAWRAPIGHGRSHAQTARLPHARHAASPVGRTIAARVAPGRFSQPHSTISGRSLLKGRPRPTRAHLVHPTAMAPAFVCAQALPPRRRALARACGAQAPPPLRRPRAAATPPVPASPPPRARPLRALYKFTRPHTIRGTVLGAAAGVARALLDHPAGPKAALDPALFPAAGVGVVALVLGNAFIVGINQIFDVRIDKVNKPFLPLAAGEMTSRAAWGVVLASGAVGLALVRVWFSRLIFGLYAFGMAFGTLYSVPPFRFKRFPALAAVTISCVRGFLMNFGVYHATGSALGVAFAWTPPIAFLAAFMSVFACVIALAKDLPDIRGDRLEGVDTFSTKAGPKRVLQVVVAMLSVNYAGAVAAALLSPAGFFNVPLMVIGHSVLAGLLLWRSRSVEPTKQKSIVDFYGFIWALFYAEYMMFPFI